MNTLYGIWIDHSHAFIITANEVGDMVFEEIKSSIESKHKTGIEDGEHHTLADDNVNEKRRHNEMKGFCEDIVDHIKDANEIAIFGPSTAKHQLKNFIEDKHKALAAKIVRFETSDKLTEAEMRTFVKKLFMLPRRAVVK